MPKILMFLSKPVIQRQKEQTSLSQYPWTTEQLQKIEIHIMGIPGGKDKGIEQNR